MRTPTPAPRAARAAQLMRTPTPAPRAARHTPLVRTPTPAPRAVRPTPLMRTPTPAPRMPLLPGIQVEDEVTLVATNRATMRNAAATAHRTARDQRPDTAMTEVLIELVNGSVISKNFLVPTGPVTAGTLETVVRDLKAKAEKKLKKLGGTPLPRAVPRD
ncbi:uncharacterized protein PSANT_00111 [Moesziomyces antarcticus]|uniref:Uncharacterized protein n=2 Tax=Pseudozyma antarctica TaxID=84753 RepID=A0A5C3FDI7_PSEA2|nr:uncharacterized protein PSANT_00111 [Moesziomyces antarcticus]